MQHAGASSTTLALVFLLNGHTNAAGNVLGVTLCAIQVAPDAMKLCHGRNYLDESYALLGCTLEPIAKVSAGLPWDGRVPWSLTCGWWQDAREYQLVAQYVRNSDCCSGSAAGLRVESLFCVVQAVSAPRPALSAPVDLMVCALVCGIG